MTEPRRAPLLARHATWVALAATLLAFAMSAPSASAVMVRLPSGRFANYAGMTGAATSARPNHFDQLFTNLDYSGGPIMPFNINYIVEWRPSNYGSHTPFQGNGGIYTFDYLGGIQKFFQDMAHDSPGTSNSDSVADQYNDSTGARSVYNFRYAGLLVDSDPLPPNGCPATTGHICLTDTQIQSELDGFLSALGLPADLTHEYFLVTPPDVASCFDAAGSSCSANADQHQQFCAYHSLSLQGFIYANIPDLASVNGCDPFVTFCPPGSHCSYNNGPGDAVLSAISHEHIESITDPEPNNAWTDWGSSVGGEIGDKCNNDAFSDPNVNLQDDGFGNDRPYNETINTDHYLLQREWSNQTNQCLDKWTSNGTTASARFTQSVSGPDTVQFDATGSSASPSGVAEYVWQFNDGPASQGGQNTTVETPTPTISHTFPAPGIYTVALTVMAGDGTSQGTAHAVTVLGAPTAVFAPAGGIEGAPLTLSGAGSVDPNPGGTLSYVWSFGDGSTAFGPTVTHTFRSGAPTVTLTVTDSVSRFTSTVAHTILVFDERPSAAFLPPPGRARTPVSFTGTGSDPDGSIASYAWTFGDGARGSGARVSHTYGATGHYTVTLTVIDSSGQSASVAHVVTIGPTRCVVPKLAGDSLKQARSLLGTAHCSLGKVTSPPKPHRRAGKHRRWVLVVARASPGAGAVKPRGTKVGLKMTWRAVRG